MAAICLHPHTYLRKRFLPLAGVRKPRLCMSGRISYQEITDMMYTSYLWRFVYILAFKLGSENWGEPPSLRKSSVR